MNARSCIGTAVLMLAALPAGCGDAIVLPPASLGPYDQDIIVSDKQRVTLYANGTVYFYGPTGTVSFNCGQAKETKMLPPGGDEPPQQKPEFAWRACKDSWATISYTPNDGCGPGSDPKKCDCSGPEAEAFVCTDTCRKYDDSVYYRVRFARFGLCQ